MGLGISIRDAISPALLKAASAETLKKALRAGATVLARDTRLSWKEAGRRPLPWADLAASTIKGKGNATILVDTGHLKDSITIGEVTDRTATVGSDAPYAPYHQFGTKKGLQARPFIPASADGKLTELAEKEIAGAMEAAIKSEVKG